VLTKFDGNEWLPLTPTFPPRLRPRAELRVRGEPLRYEITIEPLRLATVPLLEVGAGSVEMEGYRISQRDDLAWVADRPVFERVRLRAQAFPDFQHGPRERVVGLQDYLDLPAGFNPRTLAWAAELRRDPFYATADANVLARAVLDHIRKGGYGYTLAPGEYIGRDTIDAFWLDRKEGFCEHFAAAFVVVMRALDVPARVVTGYQGADPLPIDGFLVVRQSSAHAWAEYWQRGVGWVRADPTAAVAPERINRSRNLAPPPGLVAGALGTLSPALLAGLRDSWEAVNNRWNQWVLNYSRGQQLDLLKGLGISSPNWEDLALLLIGTLSALALAGAVWAWWDRHRVDPWVRQMERLRGAIRVLGIEAGAHEAPRTLAQRLLERRGEAARPLVALLDALEHQRYDRAAAARPQRALTREFVTAARRLGPAPR